MWYETDLRHADIFVNEMGMEHGKVQSDMPVEKLPYEEEDEEL